MPKFRLLALDIDGTLVNGRDELTAATRQALAEVAAAGIAVVLVTGRQYSRTIALAAELELTTPVVTACGALIKNPATHETLFQSSFIERTLLGWLRVVAEAGHDPVVYTDHFHDGYEYHHQRADPVCAHMLEFMSVNRTTGRVCEGLLTSPPKEAFAGFAIGTREEMDTIHDLLAARLPGELDMHVMGSPRYRGIMCEILPPGTSKWSGLRHVAAALGIADEEICAVGDDVNDIPMIRGAGLGVAMENGVDAVKQVADRIAPRNDDDGLVTVAKWLLERNCSP